MKVHIGKYKKNGDRKVNVQIDDFDTWNVDSTLALIIVPLLKKFKDVKPGAPFVGNDDVPVELHGNMDDPYNADTDPHWFARWNYVLDEMIFAFESYQTDWEDQFWSPIEAENSYNEETLPDNLTPVTFNKKLDIDAYKQYQARITNGFRLFGKYYGSLWS